MRSQHRLRFVPISTPEQLKSDSDHLAARKDLDSFFAKHQHYFEFAGRTDPGTGKLYIESKPALDRERFRLFQAYVATNDDGHKVDAQAKKAAAAEIPRRRAPR
ncbi:hypothetical protein [Paucibacter soli]|uniref:hypothetical protein n=1 Tax=Paucibacter soli TaxID=3133433 RepID=UPI00309E3967